MRKQIPKVLTILSITCIFSLLAAGCNSAPAPDTAANQVVDLTASTPDNTEPSEPETTQEDADTNTSDTAPAQNETGSANTEGKWHVLPPEIASVVDADFEGTVWKIDGNSFYIAEMTTEILDGSILLGSELSPDAEIPDSELIPVVFDANTHFYLRTIRDGGDSYEDTEAAFQDIEKNLTVEMKGSFENDVFHATEIRIVKVS